MRGSPLIEDEVKYGRALFTLALPPSYKIALAKLAVLRQTSMGDLIRHAMINGLEANYPEWPQILAEAKLELTTRKDEQNA